MSDDGQATPLIGVAVAVAAVVMMSLGPMGRVLFDRAQARTAADAAALAGAAEGEKAARTIARDNGAELVNFHPNGDEVVVEVDRAGVHAFGRAKRVLRAASDDPGGLAPAMQHALRRAEELLGRAIPVVSGYRSPAKQRDLWEQRASNPYPVAPPGGSQHERGLAIDVPGDFVDDLLAVAGAAGLCQPLAETDPVHFELC